MLRTVLGTTISIILTFGSSALIQWNRKAKDRKMTAMMVMSNKNMTAIGISEQEVMEFTTAREEKGENVGTPPDAHTFYTDAYTLDSLTSLTHLSDRIEELKAGKE